MSSDYVRLSMANKYLAQIGAPVSILSSRSKDKLSFKPIMNQILGIMIPPQQQEDVYNQLLDPNVAVGEPCLIVVGAETALSGQKLAANICEKYYDARTEPFPFIKWINLAYWDFDFLKTHQDKQGVVVIGPIDKNFDPKKLSLVRDYINTVQGSTTIVIIESPDVLSYMNQLFNLSPDILFQLGRQVVQRTR